MKLLDRLSLDRAITLILGFILSLVKLFIPKINKELENNNPIPPLPKPPIKRRKTRNDK